MIEALSLALTGAGLFFFIAGSVGLLRLPDLYSRLHALTKVDNLGLGLLAGAVALVAGDLVITLKLLLIWLLVLVSSATSAHLIAQHALRREEKR